MRFFIPLLAASFLSAQTPPSLVVKQIGSTTAYPGAVLNFEVDAVGFATWNVTAIAGLLTTGGAVSSIQLGAAAILAQKSLLCDPTTAACTMAGLGPGPTGTASNLPIADGPLLNFTFTIPNSPQLPLGSTIFISFWNPTTATGSTAVNTSAQTVLFTTSGVTLTVGPNPTCITQAQTLEAAVNTAFITASPNTSVLLIDLIQMLNAIQTTGTCQ